MRARKIAPMIGHRNFAPFLIIYWEASVDDRLIPAGTAIYIGIGVISPAF